MSDQTILGGVTLDQNMVWTDEYKKKPKYSETFETIGGGVVIQEFAKIESGTQITLESIDDFGFQKKSTVESLFSLFANAETIYTLQIDFEGLSMTKSVIIKDMEFEPIFNNEGLLSTTTWYRGKISLIIV